MKTLAILFWELFKISLFVIGGGYPILAAAQQTFERRGWIAKDELIEQLPVFQMIPGLIASHTAVYVGNKVAGALGSAVGVIAVALPSIAIFTLVSIWYRSIPLDNPWLDSAFVGLRAALTGIIAATVIRSWRKFMVDAFAYALLIAGVIAIALVGVPVWAVILASMACALIAAQRAGTKFKSVSLLPLLLFLQYGALCLGGGFVIVPMYLEDFVGASAPYLQLPPEEFSNVMALTQMTPGPIGINCATFFGYRLAGALGAVIASAMLLLPGSIAAWFVFRSLQKFRTSPIVNAVLRGIRPISIALMLVSMVVFARMAVVDSCEKFHPIGVIIGIITIIMTMKRRINVVLLIVLCALAAGILRADEITAGDFPDADSVVLNEIERVEYAPDGTSVSTSEAWSKILTERGRREESELKLGYNARYSEAKILYVGAIDSSGVEREIDVSGTTKDMTDNSSLAENIVDPLDREIVCTIPGLVIGETVHIKIQRRTFKSRIKDQWSDLSVQEWTHPILKSTYEVKAPQERPIKSRAIRHALGNITERITPLSDGSTLYTYTATNSPRMFAEPDMPPMWNMVQSIHLSTAESWRELSRWYWNVCEPHLEKTNAAISNKVEELDRDLNKIFKFVSQDIRYMGLTMEDTAPGYAPHDVDITFDNRYGVCRDKGALLAAMLRIAGYRAFPVLINVGAKMDQDVPKPYFNHAITCVEENGKYVLMDATCENTKDLCPGYLCNCSYLVARPEGETLQTSPVPAPERNAINITSRGKLGDDGTILLDSQLDFTGINDTLYRGSLVKATPENRLKILENSIKRMQPGSQLIRCDITPENLQDTTVPLRIRLLAKLPETILRGETEDTLAFPFVSRVFSITKWLLENNTALEKRRYPLMLDTTAQVQETVTLELNTALGDVKSLPPTVSLTNGCAYSRSFELKDGKLIGRRVHTVDDVEFEPDEYAHLRENMKRMEAAERKNPIFSADGAKGANVRWRTEETDVDIANDCQWIVTNTFVKEVLTYRGKKDSAELKFSFHPAWKHIEVLSATVSNLNGVVQSVKPVEMNEIDAPWSALAPRYPAGKTLIVNLPAVEIGSVISVTTVTTVTNAPASYYNAFGFDSRDPLAHRRVRVNGWQRDVRHPKRVPDEPSQPSGVLWRDANIVTCNSFAEIAPTLRQACAVEPLYRDSPFIIRNTPRSILASIRDWMARNIRIAGPSLYELPIPSQLTDPKTVIEERYATRLDYVRTLCALLRGAGLDADIVFAADNAQEPEHIRRRDKFEYPNVRAFDAALCRVRVCEGGCFGFGGTERVYFLGTENEYTPLDATAYEYCDYFDPVSEEFGLVRSMDPQFLPSMAECVRIAVRPDGSIEYTSSADVSGVGVGAIRKYYSEILPEDFNRHYQSILGSVSKAAKAKSRLQVDIQRYPFEMRFMCEVPDYAAVEGDAITLRLPPMESSLPALTGTVRETPFVLASCDERRQTVEVRFPPGYTEVEHLPSPFVFRDPLDPSRILVRNTVEQRMEDGCLVVSVRREIAHRTNAIYGSEYAELIRDWRRIGTSLASQSIVIRRKH